MTTVKIINGIYGYRPNNSPYVVPVSSRDPAISVDDDEALRLVEIGVAVIVDNEAPSAPVATALTGDSDSSTIDNSSDDEDGESGDPAPGEIVNQFDPEELKGWKMDELKKLAADLGVDTTGIKKKDDLIQAIKDVVANMPTAIPALGIEDVVE